MNYKAYQLPIGSEVISGEILQSVYPQKDPKKQVIVVLLDPKTGKTRTAIWGYYSTIFVKKTEVA